MYFTYGSKAFVHHTAPFEEHRDNSSPNINLAQTFIGPYVIMSKSSGYSYAAVGAQPPYTAVFHYAVMKLHQLYKSVAFPC